jgi:2-iminobutanoate/2-iminopropanoate deaminase
MNEIKHTEELVSTGSYSAGVLCAGWLFIRGHAAHDLVTDEVVHGTIEEEIRLTVSHIGKFLAQAGCTYADVVKCTCHLANVNDFDRFDKTYREFFTGVSPPRSTAQSVLRNGIKVEIDAIAHIPEGARSGS